MICQKLIVSMIILIAVLASPRLYGQDLVSKDIAAMARLCSLEYYVDHIPSDHRVLGELSERSRVLADSNDRAMRDIAEPVKKTFLAAQQLGIAQMIVYAGAKQTSAIETIEKLLRAAERDQSLPTDISEEYADQIFDRVSRWRTVNGLNAAAGNYLVENQKRWLEIGVPRLESTIFPTVQSPLQVSYGLIQDVGYARFTNVSKSTVTDCILQVSFNADQGRDNSKQHSFSYMYFFPELSPGQSAITMNMQPGGQWQSQMTETNPRKFNSPLKANSSKFSTTVFYDKGKSTISGITVADGLALQGQLIKILFHQGAVFASRSNKLSVSKVRSRGTQVIVNFNGGMEEATIDNTWNNSLPQSDFERHSSAFRIRIGASKAKATRLRGSGKSGFLTDFGLDTTSSYTWRGGFLIAEGIGFGTGGEMYIPILSERD